MKESAKCKRKGISGNTLKVIAIVSMFIDHLDVAVFEKSMPDGRLYQMMNLLMRTIGRLAFPIFCFLLVEGFLHTKNVKKYGIRLLLFSVLSEIPFDLAVFGKWFYPGYQNVFFTLFIGLCVLDRYQKSVGNSLKQMLVILAGCGAALILRCDYHVVGISFILIIYLYYEQKLLQTVFGAILMAVESITCFGAAALAFFPIRRYNGTRGKKRLKYFFYVFYPAHLLFLYMLHLMIVKGRIL